MKNLISYIDINIDKPERHPLHLKMFGSSEAIPSTLEWLQRSYERFGKLKNIYAVQQIIDGENNTFIIDGWKSLLVLQRMGVTTVKIAVLHLADESDIAQVMAELQKSHHNSITDEYNIYESLYNIFGKGRGTRTDLIELGNQEVETEDTANEEREKRRDNVYDIIGKMCGVSRNRVMYIVKIGRTNRHHFERIALERYSLYAAYLDCLAEEKGEEPPVPSAKAPVYHSTATEAPVYTKSSSTANNYADDKKNNNTTDEVESQAQPDFLEKAANTESQPLQEDEIVNITVHIHRKDLMDTNTGNAPEVTVDNSNPQHTIVQLKFPKI